MGYTHYWDRPDIIDGITFLAILKDFNKVLPFITNEMFIGDGSGEGEPPKLTESIVSFNGVGDDSHESFHFPRNYGDNVFNFTKTAMKPYDVAVVAFLAISKVHLRSCLHVSTDGDDRDWQPGLRLCSNILGHDYDNLDITENGKLRYKHWDKVE